MLTPSGITRLLQRLNPDRQKRAKGRQRKSEQKARHNSCGGFELIVALSYHLGWPQITADTIYPISKVKGFLTNDFVQNPQPCGMLKYLL